MSDPRPNLTTDPSRPVRLVSWRLEERPILLDGQVIAEARVVYTLLLPCDDGTVCPYPLYQPCLRAASPVRHPGVHVWAWDGDTERPTLTPSYLARLPWGDDQRLVRVHLYLRAGRIDLLSDSTVTLDIEGT